MEINVRSESKIVEIWLSKHEKQAAELQIKLKTIYGKCKANGYMAVEFISGTEPLPELTSSLLCYNRTRIAQLEVVYDKTKQGNSMAVQ